MGETISIEMPEKQKYPNFVNENKQLMTSASPWLYDKISVRVRK